MTKTRNWYYVLIVFVLPFAVSGCLAVAAGAAGGAEAAENSQIDYYLAIHNPRPDIYQALEDKEIVKGMTKEQVRLIMSTKTPYQINPNSKSKSGNREIWFYTPQGKHVEKDMKVVFTDGVVTEFRRAQ